MTTSALEAMDRHDEGPAFLFPAVLKLVNGVRMGDGNHAMPCPPFERVRQIHLEVATVRHSLLRLQIEAEFHPAVPDLHGQHEPLQRGESPSDLFGTREVSIRFQEEAGQLLGQKRNVPYNFRRVDRRDSSTGRGCPASHRPEQHVLSHTTASGQEDALRGLALLASAEEHLRLGQDVLTSNPLRRGGPHPR